MKILHHTVKFGVPSQTFINNVIDMVEDTGAESLVITHHTFKTEFYRKVININNKSNFSFIEKLRNFSLRKLGYCENIAFFKAKKVLNDFEPDIIHCHFGNAGYYSYYIQKFLNREIPTVISLHGYDVFKLRVLPNDYKKTLYALSKRENAVFTVPSLYLKKKANESLHIPLNKIVVLPNSFNSSLFRPSQLSYDSSTTLRIANVSRFVDWKGQRYLIQAISHLGKLGLTNLHVDFIGDGKELANCKQLALELGIQNKCTFHGAVSHEMVARLIEPTHLYVHTAVEGENGHTETFGVALLEAIAMGKPAVYFETGGIPEVLGEQHTKYYIGIQPKNVHGLSEAILKMQTNLLSNQVNNDISDYISFISTKFSAENTTKQLFHIYEAVRYN